MALSISKPEIFVQFCTARAKSPIPMHVPACLNLPRLRKNALNSKIQFSDWTSMVGTFSPQ